MWVGIINFQTKQNCPNGKDMLIINRSLAYYKSITNPYHHVLAKWDPYPWPGTEQNGTVPSGGVLCGPCLTS